MFLAPTMPTTRSRRSSPPAASAAAAPGPRYTLHGQLGSSGKDKAVFDAICEATQERVAVACYHKNKGKSIQVEARQQRRAASVGVAPQLFEVDARQRRLVMQLMPRGTLIELARQQHGRLTIAQQQRIVQLLRCLGTPETEGGAGLRHGDCGNPANYVASADGTLFLIDFAPPHCRDMPAKEPDDANLGSLGMLLWHAERGLLRRGWVTEPPLVLLREYRLFCRRSGMSDPMDPEPDVLPAALPAATVDLEPPQPRRSRAKGAASRRGKRGVEREEQQPHENSLAAPSQQPARRGSRRALAIALLWSIATIAAAGAFYMARHEVHAEMLERLPLRLSPS